jgi:glutathione synthase/RimK-type ligase-like ATP-grasp enzyme/ribosomal protein S18 acetylase RimI-like enzyme
MLAFSNPDAIILPFHTVGTQTGKNNMHVRDAVEADLDFLVELESMCFPAHRRSARRSLRNSIVSSGQRVLVVETAQRDRLLGAATVFYHKHSLRLYSIAVLPQERGTGTGYLLLQHVLQDAKARGCLRVTLEADAQDERLLQWYRRCGFRETELLEDYYAPAEAAQRMELSLKEPERDTWPVTGNVIVVDKLDRWPMMEVPGVEVVSADAYLSEERFRNSEDFHVLNLCSSYKSQTVGYYVSLLGTARNHRILPTVTTMKDMRNLAIAQRVVEEIEDYLVERLEQAGEHDVEITVMLGYTPDVRYSELGRKLFTLFQLPFFSIRFAKAQDGEWRLRRVTVLSLSNVLLRHPEQVRPALTAYFDRKRYRRTKLKNYRYDLAILVNTEEKTPPSCSDALKKFRSAAEQTGFAVEFIGKMDYRRISEFDALFIRETTSLENHTYRFARHAYTEGLVVIDDPWSILYCSNKIYLHERLARGRIRQPRSWLLKKEHLTGALPDGMPYPVVLKLPESAFSLGVFRVDDPQQLRERLRTMLERCDLVIAQEFLETGYDWRVGMIDQEPLYACKYFMARGHWQIYNWSQPKEGNWTGGHESVPIEKVPPAVIKAAVKSSSLIGDGLYGVDLKEVNGQVYVIEINDNPNIDEGIEDQLAGDALYLRIMQSMFNRIDKERNRPRYLA